MSRVARLVGRGIGLALLVVGFASMGGEAPAAWADTFKVNTLTDEDDTNPGDGICRNVSGGCSLRAAVQETNARPGADTIILPKGKIDLLRSPLPRVTQSLTIIGEGASVTRIRTTIVDIGQSIFQFPDAATSVVNITGVHLEGGDVGFRCQVSMACNLTGVTISHAREAGIANVGQMVLRRSLIEDIGGVDGRTGLSIASSQGFIRIDSTTIRNGRLFQTPIVGTVTNTGGGVMIITNSTISNNVSPQGTGGIYNEAVLELTNSTVSSNAGNPSGGVGGIRNHGFVSLKNVTIAENTGVGLSNAGAGVVDMQNSILATNTPQNCSGTIQINADIQRRQNFESGSSCNLSVNDRSNTNPLLGPLQNNGGPTHTHVLRAGSRALEQGNCILPTDQRGITRPQDGNADGDLRCDIGAVESQAQDLSGGIGVPSLSPSTGAIDANRRYPLTLRWDVPEPFNWAALTTIDLRVRSGSTTLAAFRWDQLTDLFQLLDTQGQPLEPPFLAGTPFLLGTDPVFLDLAGVQTQTSGLTGRFVTLTLPLLFAESLQGKTLDLEAAATGDLGQSDPFRSVGSVTIVGPGTAVSPIPVPVVVREDQPNVRKPTETEKAQQQRTNRLGLDDHRVEGNVLRLRTEPGMIEVIIANRDGEVTLKLRGEALEVGKHVQPGQYVVGRGEKEHEQLYWIDDLNIDR